MFGGTMLWFLCLPIILGVFNNYSFGANLIQEGAFVKSCNPKYITNCTAITKRLKRGEPYRTNAGFTSLYNWSNNVTYKIKYGLKSLSEMVVLKTKACEALKVGWMRDFIKTSSNMPVTCPVTKGSYQFHNMEMPPKNFPLPIPAVGTMFVTIGAEVTETGEDIGEIAFICRYV